MQRRSLTILLNNEIVANLSEEINLSALNDEFELVEKAFESLKRKEVALLQLRFYESLSFKDVGEILGITENNAKVRCYRILDKIRIAIEQS